MIRWRQIIRVEIRKKLRDLKKFKNIQFQRVLVGNSPYQKRVMIGCVFLNDYNFVVVYDDMGLGNRSNFSTFTISKESGVASPSLLVMPTSLIYN